MLNRTKPSKQSKCSYIYGFLAIAACLVAIPAHAKVVKVNGQNDMSADRAAIQSAIDSAPSKAIIQLRGTFQLDGTAVLVNRSDLTLVGVGSDARLLGQTCGGGLPATGKNGIVIQAGPQPVENIQIKNLEICGFNIAVVVLGEEAGLDDIDVKNLRMTDNGVGVLINGAVNDLEVSNNQIMSSIWGGIFVTEGPLPNLSNALITENRVNSANLSLIPFALEIQGPASDVLVSGNILQGGAYAVGLFGEASNVMLTDNWILDGGTQGWEFARGGGILLGVDALGFYTPASGYTIAGNRYANNLASTTLPSDVLVPRDIWLYNNASNNEIIERAGTVVLDEGTNNTVTLVSDP